MKTLRLALLCLPLVWACSDPAEPIPVATVEVTPASPQVVVGGQVQLSATVKDAAGNVLTDRLVTWTSGNTAGAAVNSSGLVMTAQVGTAIITATSEGITANATVTVNPPPVATVAVDPGTANLIVGRQQQFNATVRDANGNVLTGRTVTWTSSNQSVGTITSAGLFTAVGAGTTTVTATSEGRTATASVNVTLAPVASISISPPGATINVGGVQQFSATVRDASGNVLTGRSVAWSSSNQAIATISAGGLALGIASGTTIITAISEGQATSVALVVNPIPVASVEVTPSTGTLNIGATQQLTVTLRDQSGNVLTGRNITYSSSNTGVATVSGTGLVTAVAAGNATITVNSEGRIATATFTVNAALPTIALRSVTQGGTNVNMSNVSGTVIATYDVTLPAGHAATAISINLGGREICRVTVTSTAISPLEVQCTINTLLTENGTRVFPNGQYILSARVLGASDTVLASHGISMQINNP